MSVQGTNLKAIADAIREKDGTTASIKAKTFPERIRAIQTNNLPDGVRHINVTASDPEGGTVSGGGIASDGMTLTVNAEPNNSYKFNGWKENGIDVTSDNMYIFRVINDRALIASFDKIIWPIWTSGNHISGNYRGITYGGGRFVVYNSDFSFSAFSLDGKNWTYKSFNSLFQIPGGICYGNNKFIVPCGANGNKIAYSSDGLNWQTSMLPSTGNWYNSAYGNGKFIVFRTGSVYAAYSATGMSWNACSLPSSYSWQNIIFGNDKFIICDNKNNIAYSSDGITWETRNISIIESIARIRFANNLFFIAEKNNYNILHISEDGLNWETINMPFSAYWMDIAYGNGKFMAVATSSQGLEKRCAYSTNGTNWTIAEMNEESKWKMIVFGNNVFVAIANAIITPPYCITE